MLDFRGKSRDYAVHVMKRIWLRQLAVALLMCAAGFLLLQRPGLVSLIAGAAWSLLDDIVVFGAAVMGYGTSVPVMRRWLVRMFVTRLSLGVIFTVLMLGLKQRVAEAMIGFILLHIFFIINLKNFTRLKE